MVFRDVDPTTDCSSVCYIMCRTSTCIVKYILYCVFGGFPDNATVKHRSHNNDADRSVSIDQRGGEHVYAIVVRVASAAKGVLGQYPRPKKRIRILERTQPHKIRIGKKHVFSKTSMILEPSLWTAPVGRSAHS